MQRLWCPPCGHTVSVLPAHRLPYRSLGVERLEGGFDAQVEVGTGLDPPPEPVEAGCLQRAWHRFRTRVKASSTPSVSSYRLSFSPLSNSGKRCAVAWVRRRPCCGFWLGIASARSWAITPVCARPRSSLHRAVWFAVGNGQRLAGCNPTKGFSSPARFGALTAR